MTLVFFLVRVPQLGCLGVEGAGTIQSSVKMHAAYKSRSVSLVWFTEQALQAQENTLHIVHSTPLVFQDIQTDTSREVHVGVVNGGFEEDGWWRVRVIVREGERELECQALIRSLVGAADGGSPGSEVAISIRKCGDTGRRREHKLHQFRLEAMRMDRSQHRFPFYSSCRYNTV